jgi:hypothetical protein
MTSSAQFLLFKAGESSALFTDETWFQVGTSQKTAPFITTFMLI